MRADANAARPFTASAASGPSLGVFKIGDLEPFVVQDLFVAVHQVKVAAHEPCRVWGPIRMLIEDVSHVSPDEGPMRQP